MYQLWDAWPYSLPLARESLPLSRVEGKGFGTRGGNPGTEAS